MLTTFKLWYRVLDICPSFSQSELQLYESVPSQQSVQGRGQSGQAPLPVFFNQLKSFDYRTWWKDKPCKNIANTQHRRVPTLSSKPVRQLCTHWCQIILMRICRCCFYSFRQHPNCCALELLWDMPLKPEAGRLSWPVLSCTESSLLPGVLFASRKWAAHSKYKKYHIIPAKTGEHNEKSEL